MGYDTRVPTWTGLLRGLAVTVRPPAYLRGMSRRGMSEGSDSTSGDISIDCGSCLARPAACGDCIVTVLLGPIGMVGQEERVAFAVLADSGLVPPLRLVTGDQGVA